MLKRLIEGWRGAWKQGNSPFYIVQLSTIGKSDPNKPEGCDGRAAIRNAQLEALTAIPNTGLAVTVEIGADHEYRPDKYDVSLRLSAWALNKAYGKTDVVPCGLIGRLGLI